MNYKKNKMILSMILIVAILIGIMVGFRFFQSRLLKGNSSSSDTKEEYKYHIAMIVENKEDIFWKSVIEYAKKAGKEKGILVENFGGELRENYTKDELMDMAIAARVDGIILKGDQRQETKDLIQKADEHEIPVITVGSDAAGSKRKSFIGVNEYTLGESFGHQIVGTTNQKNQKVVVLLPSDNGNSPSNLTYSAIADVVEKSEQFFSLSSRITGGKGEFESEEIVRDILLPQEERPDILICLSAVDTMSASQCLVDYNLVGEVRIIGSYISDKIEENILKGIIDSTIAINADEMGEYGVGAMYDYLTKEYVSDYIPVESQLITQKNVKDYEKQKEN
ncbi:ribose transport system substrate-binding protein [Aequitasia blattaphilus]|uniref:Substrate-binding domain-containing protein n=1 Tax=Aequitasia blattaphilus TaxID=2949332 RepID=A0ABT1EAI6_9FIRM|nr:substrate-binding domain-containing protein [Aequitasia blattaphilus]MCP1102840.1 substrate-binding domain-containing protein [Aequitasia blattaphilus]MCR8615480.1 substrate-binding domain-containing protein [Aequitasia blattaphilus]